MTKDVEISIIIVNYKTKALTLDCIRSVYEECRGQSFEIILADNNSEDGTVEAVRELHPGVQVIALEKNVGFARANNAAAKYASGEYILLLNPDTVVLDNAIFRLLEFAKQNPHGGVWGGRTVFADRSLNPPSCWGKLTIWNLFCNLSGLSGVLPNSPLFNSVSYGGWLRDSVREVDIITGCFLLIRRSLWDRLGGFDPVYFMYGEDSDLSLRVKALGFRPMITPHATIVHYNGASEWLPARKQTQLFAAAITIIDRHWPRPKRFWGRLLIKLYPYPRLFSYFMLTLVHGRAGNSANRLEIWKTVLSQKQQWVHGFKASGTEEAPRYEQLRLRSLEQ